MVISNQIGDKNLKRMKRILYLVPLALRWIGDPAIVDSSIGPAIVHSDSAIGDSAIDASVVGASSPWSCKVLLQSQQPRKAQMPTRSLSSYKSIYYFEVRQKTDQHNITVGSDDFGLSYGPPNAWVPLPSIYVPSCANNQTIQTTTVPNATVSFNVTGKHHCLFHCLSNSANTNFVVQVQVLPSS